MGNNNKQNRRNYFRVQDRAVLEYAICTDSSEPMHQFFKMPVQYQLMSEFQLLDIDAQSLLRGIYEKDRNLGAYLKVINRKLDSLCRTMALISDPIDQNSLQDVNLSEGGLSFYPPQPLAVGAQLMLKLILLPSYSGLLVHARVLSCSDSQDRYETHLEFTDLDEHQRQLLARHILRKQQEERRLRDDL